MMKDVKPMFHLFMELPLNAMEESRIKLCT